MFCFRFLKIFLFLFNFYYSQPILDRTFDYYEKNAKYDHGIQWHEISSILNLRYNYFPKSENLGSSYHNSLGSFVNKNTLYLRSIDNFIFKNHFYIFIDSKLQAENLDQFKSNKKINFSTSINSSGIGYQNDWTLIQVGKGKENWGSGNNISLGLGSESENYDYFLLASNYGKIRVSFLYGFLERTESDYNRFITARGLEWTNKKSLVISLSEVVIYSGFNRSFDIAYLNPISSHLELELNNRLNISGTGSANAVWQFHLDFLFRDISRISINYLFDEFVLDPKLELNKEHGKAYSVRKSFKIFSTKTQKLNLFFSRVMVGTPTFRHSSGTSNFVNKNKPMGWIYGSDGTENSIGFNFFKEDKFILKNTFSIIHYGEENLLKNPYSSYKDYLKGPFPSGEIRKTKVLKIFFSWNYNKNLRLQIRGSIQFQPNEENISSLYFGIISSK